MTPLVRLDLCESCEQAPGFLRWMNAEEEYVVCGSCYPVELYELVVKAFETTEGQQR
ncbi:MAG TPA: hypothetical protein VGA20_09435 [Gemmatimonadales bacterium]